MRQVFDRYFATLVDLLRHAEVTDRDSSKLELHVGCEKVRDAAHQTHDAGNKLMFIGNGGSSGIASHLAIDFTKNGKLRSMAFNDAAALTCLGNDFGYEDVFAKQLEFHARAGDLLIAISSSGRSPNILKAVSTARARNCRIVTYSGFSEDNDLRKTGDINFYVDSHEYGFVEVSHVALCHAILDIDMGWGRPA